ncbi:hypothetical protein SAMD00019534_098110, partial [Acytostelium subglobosum LB1]|uniref:hypothetical protein n=1 Tax=Acytostelium subglobosum LB1 TaxID=1410327 RepID=UPI000644B29B
IECEQILKQLNTKLPLYGLFYADVAWMKSTLTEDKDDLEETAKRISDCKKLARSIQLSQKPLYLKQEKDEKKSAADAAADGGKQCPPSQFTKAEYLIGKLVYAEAMLMRGIMELKQQSNIKAGISFRKAWKQFYQALEIVQTLPQTFPCYQHIASSAFYGVGIFHFLVSAVPPQYVWLVEGIGFKANRMEGVRELKYSADLVVGIRSTLSKCFFTMIYAFFFEDFERAEETMRELLVSFPDSAMINYMAGSIARKKGDIPTATLSFRNALKTADRLKQLQLYIESELGYNEFLDLNWVAAEQYLAKFLKETTSSGFKAYIAYQLAYCYEMQDMREQALEMMKSVDKTVRKGYDFDEFSLRKANRYIKNKQLTQFERHYTRASLLNEAHRFQDSIVELEAALALTPLTHEELGAGEYLMGYNLQMLNMLEDSKKYYLLSMAHEKHLQYDHFILPYANVGMAEIMLHEDKKAECRAFIKKAKGYHSIQYDFPALLDWRARKCLQMLGE